MKFLIDYIRNLFIRKPIAETGKEEENYFLIH
jgi:hypothetical protein